MRGRHFTRCGACVASAIAYAWLIAGCHREHAPSAPVIPADPGVAVFESTCIDCHDEPGQLAPDLAAALTPELATRAMNLVIEHMMPPRSSESAPEGADRAHLIAWLCRRSRRNEQACDRLVRWETAPPIVRRGPTLLSNIHDMVGAPVPPPASDVLKKAALPQSPRSQLNGSMVAALIAAEMTACTAAVTPAPTPPPSNPSAAPNPPPASPPQGKGFSIPITVSPEAAEARAKCVEKAFHATTKPPAEVVP